MLEIEEDEEIFKSVNEDTKKIEESLEDAQLILLLNGKYDNENCILEIHPGAGGT